MKWLALSGFSAAAFLSTGVGVAADLTAASTEWPTYGHDPGGMRFSPLKQIDTTNVTRLKVAWVYHMRTRAGMSGAAVSETAAPEAAPAEAGPMRASSRFRQSETTPLVVDGVMYTSTPYRRVVALDATTGKEIWTYEGQAPTRGIEYWPGDATHPPQIMYELGSSLIALDAATGKPVQGFGDHGILDRPALPEGQAAPDGQVAPVDSGGVSSPPIVYKNLVITASANPYGDGRYGDIRAFDARDGKQVWRFNSIPLKGEKFYDTWAPGSTGNRGGVRVWGLMTVDAQRGIVYMPFNAPRFDRYGGDREGLNLFSSSIVALDANTGKYLWHFQVIHHDIWDGDPGAPPALFDVRKDGKTIPAVGIISKNGLLFLLDRVTGKPIYEVEERPVAKSDIPEEKTWPTQPFPVKPAPLARMTMSMADIATVTPELYAFCKKLIEDHNIGMGGPYMPPGFNRPTVNFPGTIGSANWGGMSFSPELGYVFINSHDLGQITGIGPKGAPREVIGVAGAGSAAGFKYDMVGLLGRFKDPKTNMMCQEPPWGSLTAVDVNSGEIAWQVRLGVTDALPEGKQNTGRPNLGGTIVTAGGLVFIGATDDARFRAFDAKTGKELWTEKLAASSHSVPITYLGKDGKQYLVFPSTGGSFLQDPAGDDSIRAYALP